MTSLKFLLFVLSFCDPRDSEGLQNVELLQQLLFLALRDLAGLQAQKPLGLLLQEPVSHLMDLAHIDQIGLAVLLILGVGQLRLFGLQFLDEF